MCGSKGSHQVLLFDGTIVNKLGEYGFNPRDDNSGELDA